ncbi:MAG: YegS/Rv2252/BmrU family lipid kinase [Clostridiales Family XIII bacterium]|nr:YegS/Rv2252/BmrU family lipid kinase [Clostridiales Family XIII bacterium]
MKKPDKVLLFYNPSSGNGFIKDSLDRVIKEFQKKNMFIMPIRADAHVDIDNVLRRIKLTEYKKIIAAGGDGTVSSVVNAMMRNKLELPLAVFPAGTANDFAYCLDIPQRIEEMINIAIDDKTTAIDVGVANERFFINVLAMGMIVDVSQKTDPGIKSTLGMISYYIRGFSELPNLRPLRVRVKSEEFSGEENIFFMLVMNGRSAGGFRRIAPCAQINDGLLDVLLFKEMPIMEMAPLLINVLTGQHHENKNVIFFQTGNLSLESDEAAATDMDGETGDNLPLNISVMPKRINVITQRAEMIDLLW